MVLIGAPRRFGKSVNMDMVKKFVEIEVNDKGDPIELNKDKDGFLQERQEKSTNFKFFVGKKIFTIEKDGKQIFNQKFFTHHFGCRPVIYVNFKEATGSTYEEVLVGLKSAIHGAFKSHNYLLEKDENYLKILGWKVVFAKWCHEEEHKSMTVNGTINGLQFLSELLYHHFNKRKVFVFVDEFDSPISNVIYNENYPDKEVGALISTLNILTSTLLKQNDYVRKALLNSCHHFAGILLQHANNVYHYRFLSYAPFCKFYGFTEDEVKAVLHTMQLSERFNDVKAWYNGYSTECDSTIISIYCPYSVASFAFEKKLKQYCVASSFNKVEHLLSHNKIFNKFNELLEGNSIRIHFEDGDCVKDLKRFAKKDMSDVTHKIDCNELNLFYQLLYEQGLLNPKIDSTFQDIMMTLKIPNMEIMIALKKVSYTAKLWNKYLGIKETDVEDFNNSIIELATNTNEKTITDLATKINQLFNNAEKLPKKEVEFLAPIYSNMVKKFKLTDCEAAIFPGNKESPRFDIFSLIDVKNKGITGIVFELKYNRCSSVDALNQIIDKKYYETLDNQEVVHKIYLGIHMDTERNVTITYLINNTDKAKAVTVRSS